MDDLRHTVLATPIAGPVPEEHEVAVFGMGCFWGAERLFWRLPGVYTTSVGYAQGQHPNPDYRLVCTGTTGHAEVVRVVFDPREVSYETLLKTFWENHDPTQGNRQGNDIGTQYRSIIATTTSPQRDQAVASWDAFAPVVASTGLGAITTEIEPAGTYHLAEADHQQYLDKHPGGYCNHGPNGMTCPVGTTTAGGAFS